MAHTTHNHVNLKFAFSVKLQTFKYFPISLLEGSNKVAYGHRIYVSKANRERGGSHVSSVVYPKGGLVKSPYDNSQSFSPHRIVLSQLRLREISMVLNRAFASLIISIHLSARGWRRTFSPGERLAGRPTIALLPPCRRTGRPTARLLYVIIN